MQHTRYSFGTTIVKKIVSLEAIFLTLNAHCTLKHPSIPYYIGRRILVPKFLREIGIEIILK